AWVSRLAAFLFPRQPFPQVRGATIHDDIILCMTRDLRVVFGSPLFSMEQTAGKEAESDRRGCPVVAPAYGVRAACCRFEPPIGPDAHPAFARASDFALENYPEQKTPRSSFAQRPAG